MVAAYTHVDDPLLHKLPSTKSPIKRLYAAIASEKVGGTDVRILRKSVNSCRGGTEGGRPVNFVEDELNDFVCDAIHVSNTESMTWKQGAVLGRVT